MYRILDAFERKWVPFLILMVLVLLLLVIRLELFLALLDKLFRPVDDIMKIIHSFLFRGSSPMFKCYKIFNRQLKCVI